MNLPAKKDDSISREALERIIQRAAELQASEQDFGDNLTEEDVKQLGKDVGLPARFVQQALVEEKHRLTPSLSRLDNIMGPAHIQVRRTVPGKATDISDVLEHWLTESELLVVKRRYPNHTSWEAQPGFVAGLRRDFGVGGRSYHLSQATEIVTEIDPLESGWCHVTIGANLSNNRTAFAAGAASMATTGGLAGGALILMGIAIPAAVVPGLLGIGVGALILRRRRSLVDRISVAMEQILDRLERGEIKKPEPEPAYKGLLPKRIVDEFRKHLSP